MSGQVIAPAPRRRVLPPGEIILADVEWLVASKEWPPRIAERLGISLLSLSRALYRLGRPELAQLFEAFVREQRRLT